MLHTLLVTAALALHATASPISQRQAIDSSSSTVVLPGGTNQKLLSPAGNQEVGNLYNYWTLLNTSSGLVYDLTRSDRLPVTSPKNLTNVFSSRRKSAIIEPSRTALVIIDMQNFFLHPQLSPAATGGRWAVRPTLNMIDTFRSMGSKVLWTQWGFDNFDLLTAPPADLEGFSSDESNVLGSTFGSDMGTISEGNTTIEVGRKLWRGAWNAQPYGDLYPAYLKGIKAGTDLLFNKNRLSGLWGAQTPLGLYLQENQITTLFFGGVNADQCVWGNFIDAYFKGFDVVYVDDISQTVSPFAAREMTRYNAGLDGFVGNSTEIIAAINASGM